MSTKRFTVLPNNDEPVMLEFVDPEGTVLGLFRFTRRPRLDIAIGMANAVQLKDGKREIDRPSLLWVLRQLMINEIRDVESGEWSPADDRDRFDAILNSDRHKIDWDILGEMAIWLSEELSEHPTGASSPS